MNAPPIAPAGSGTSTRPYLIRALHDWCSDNGYTPYIAVFVDARVQVPVEYVKNNEIVLNVGFEATTALKLGNEAIEFKARFGGKSRDIVVPVDHVIAIYARENGQGMAFPSPTQAPATQEPDTGPARGPRLALTESNDAAGVAEAAHPPAGDGSDSSNGREGAKGRNEPPPPSDPPPGKRASLKRVK
jgi:stringent starvation protein B